VLLVPATAVGAVGVPVNEGDAIVALNAISEVFVVILEVFEAILVSNATSAFVALVISAVMLVVFAAIAFVLDVILNVFAAIALVFDVILALLVAISDALVVILEVFDVTLVFNDVISAMLLVILEVFEAIEFVFDVMLAVFAAIDVGKVAIVDEITPPTLFTVGKSAVPPKSFVNLSLPLFVASASGV